jgi:hypothetical protein
LAGAVERGSAKTGEPSIRLRVVTGGTGSAASSVGQSRRGRRNLGHFMVEPWVDGE